MARVPTLDPTEFSPELAELVGHPTSEPRMQLGALPAYAVQPQVAAAFSTFKDALHDATTLPPRLLELVRLRIAFHNRCRSCMSVRSAAAVADGLTDGAVCSLERPEEAADLTAAEKSALRYADLLANDHFSIDDDTFDDLRRYFTDAEVVELCAHVGLCVGFGRVAMSWDLVDELPPSFRGEADTVVPWSPEVILR